MANQHNRHLLLLTFGTLLISTSGSLGRFIDMPTPVIIWWRCLLGALFLYAYCKYRKINLKIQAKRDIPTIVLSAIFLGAHWITYFLALKLSNVAIGMLSLFTFPVMTALLEPIFTKSKLNPIHIILSLVVLLGIYILAPSFDFESDHMKGILFGLLSAFLYALRNLLLKRHTINYNGSVLMIYQTIIITVLLVPTLFWFSTKNITTQYPYILILALVTTAIGHSFFIGSLRYFSVSTASIISSTQPIFGIIIAAIFLNEIPTLNTFIGGTLIILTAITEGMRSRKT